MIKDKKMKNQAIELTVDDHDFEIWIHNGHEKVEFYSLSDEDKQHVFEQLKLLEENLGQFKSYTGYCLE